ncbi:hypothetical protein J8273_0683 [Carpediemonas membranifera]|uniref:Uncharacterized protein n=1 Tax=Carpediemonas membranifera TaxID=201153 RepID=A0A8J6E4S2_9EUKA|nr:hypothetical protein J8273_0683 [Carpediemonas membranifera]|eukprot:KAG9397553.1 hypothetical protein J8273_0683 [Carpediemonas membranifera]
MISPGVRHNDIEAMKQRLSSLYQSPSTNLSEMDRSGAFPADSLLAEPVSPNTSILRSAGHSRSSSALFSPRSGSTATESSRDFVDRTIASTQRLVESMHEDHARTKAQLSRICQPGKPATPRSNPSRDQAHVGGPARRFSLTTPMRRTSAQPRHITETLEDDDDEIDPVPVPRRPLPSPHPSGQPSVPSTPLPPQSPVARGRQLVESPRVRRREADDVWRGSRVPSFWIENAKDFSVGKVVAEFNRSMKKPSLAPTPERKSDNLS